MGNYLSKYTGTQIDAMIALCYELLNGKGLGSVNGVVQRDGTTGAFSTASIPQGTVTSISAGAGLNTSSDDSSTDGGTITGTGTIRLTKSGAVAGSYGDASAQTPTYGGTFKVPYITVDKYGRITAISAHNVTIPASDNTTYTFGTGTSNGTFKVTPSGGSAQSVSIYGLTNAAFTAIASSITSGGTGIPLAGTIYSFVTDAIAALPEPMIFKGSLGTGGMITTLPTAAAQYEGFTYKVITAGTYASKAAKVGDTFICANSGSSTYEWVLIPSGDEPSGTVTSVGISGGDSITVSGSPITTSGTITLGLKLGYTTSGNNRKVQADANGNLYVEQKDTNTHRPIKVNGTQILGDNTTALNLKAGSNVTLGTSGGEVTINATAEPYSLPLAADGTRGGVQIGYTQSGKNYPVQLSNEKMYVNVPWENTTYEVVSKTANGLCPQLPNETGTTKYLRQDGTWVVPPGATYTAGTGLSLSNNQFSVKLGYTTDGNNRKVQADSNGNLYVIQKDNNTTYTLTNALSSHKFTWTLTPSSGSATTTTLELVAGSNISLTDDTTNKKITIAATDTKYSAGTGLSLSNGAFSVRLSYTTSGNNRKVQADSSGNLYVVQKDTWTANSSSAAGYVPSGGTAKVSTGITKVYATNSSNVPAWHDPWVIGVETTSDLYTAITSRGWDDAFVS